MVINLKRLVQGLILVAVLLTPLFSAGEVYALLRGLVHSQAIAYTPTYIKGLKDLFLLLIAGVGILGVLLSGRVSRLAVPSAVLLLYVLAVVIPSALVDPRMAAAGLRWILPVFLIFLLTRYVDEPFLRRLARLMGVLLIAHVALQVLQLFFMARWYGVTAFGLAARVPGIFFIPSTAAFFSILSLFFGVAFLRRGRLRTAVLFLAPASVVLTQSGSGMMVLAALGVLFALGPTRTLVALPFAPVFAAALLMLLPRLTGRGDDYVQISGGTRVEIFAEVLTRGEWFPLLFGHATNTAVVDAHSMAAAGEGEALWIIADSTYASIVGNLGIPGLVALIASGILWMIVLLAHRRVDLYAFTGIYALFGFTTIITEAYPMNLIFAVLAAYFANVLLRRESMLVPADSAGTAYTRLSQASPIGQFSG
jgi:hypothetical protein